MDTTATQKDIQKLAKIKQDFSSAIEKSTEDYHKKIKKILRGIDERKLAALRKQLNA